MDPVSTTPSLDPATNGDSDTPCALIPPLPRRTCLGREGNWHRRLRYVGKHPISLFLSIFLSLAYVCNLHNVSKEVLHDQGCENGA